MGSNPVEIEFVGVSGDFELTEFELAGTSS